jgi:hypothetical protein
MGFMRPTFMPRRTHCVRAGVAAVSVAFALAAGAADNQAGSASRGGAIAAASQEQGRMLMTVGAQRFTITLEDNPTARAFLQLLPVVLDMAELNGNEKHAKLPRSLPTDPERPGTIRAGDLLLYGDDTLVLFYETFRSGYSYTRIGRIEESSGLSRALGRGNQRIAFAVP